MKARNMGKWTGAIVGGAIGAFLSGFTATMGATLTGLREGGWNWQYLPFVLGGWFVGAVLALLCILWLASQDKPDASLFLPLIGPPIMAFILGAIAFPIMSHSDKSAGNDRLAQGRALLQQLESDPEKALREKWYDRLGAPTDAVIQSFSNPRVPYTTGMLGRFYQEAPITHQELFKHPACDREFLVEYFQRVVDRARTNNTPVKDAILASMALNPNTPSELLEKIAATTSAEYVRAIVRERLQKLGP